MAVFLQDLDQRFPITDENGKPTDYFLRLLRGQTGELGDAVDTVEGEIALKADKTITLTAGTGIDGGGDLSANRTFDLADTAVSPGTYGDASNVGQFTVDQQGRITAAANVAVSGGGGGGAGLGWSTTGIKRSWWADANAIQVLGWPTTTASGSDLARSTAVTNRLTRMNRRARSTVTANATVGWSYDAGVPPFLTSSGYIYEAVFAPSDGAAIGEKRLFVGMRDNDAGLPANTNPSTLTNIIAMAADTGDANWQIMRNDGAGTAIKVDTGWAKALNEVFYVRITTVAGSVKIYVERYASANLTMTPTATFPETTYTTDIPADTVNMAPIMHFQCGATAQLTAIDGIYQSILSPF